MGLAQADAAVEEQRVVGLARVARHLDGGGLGELVALALDEAVEGEVRVDPAAEHASAPARRGSARRADRRRCRHRQLTAGRTRPRASAGAGSDIEHHIGTGAVGESRISSLIRGSELSPSHSMT